MLVLPCALRARQLGVAEDSVGWMDRLADEWMDGSVWFKGDACCSESLQAPLTTSITTFEENPVIGVRV